MWLGMCGRDIPAELSGGVIPVLGNDIRRDNIVDNDC